MTKPMKHRDLVRKLEKNGYVFERDTGKHTVYLCPCGRHQAQVPRHKEMTAGVVRSIISQAACLPKGWLQ